MWYIYISIKHWTGILGICLFFFLGIHVLILYELLDLRLTLNVFSVWIGWLSINYLLILQLHSRMTILVYILIIGYEGLDLVNSPRFTTTHAFTSCGVSCQARKTYCRVSEAWCSNKDIKICRFSWQLLKKFGKWRRLCVGTAGSALQAKRQWETWQ